VGRRGYPAEGHPVQVAVLVLGRAVSFSVSGDVRAGHGTPITSIGRVKALYDTRRIASGRVSCPRPDNNTMATARSA